MKYCQAMTISLIATLILLGVSAPTLTAAQGSSGQLGEGMPERIDELTGAVNLTVVLIPEGEFEMGDHHGLGAEDASHPTDEIPIHSVFIDSFYMGTTEITNQQYVEYLNSARSQGLIEVRAGIVYGVGGSDVYFQTHKSDTYSQIDWDGNVFAVLRNQDSHPVTSVQWVGAAAYTNWLSIQNGYDGCYDILTWQCDFSRSGFRLPTEAEWEYAGRGGQYDPYAIFPWGDEADNSKANWPNSGDPYEVGPYPWTTPVGFFNGQLQHKSDFDWPGMQDSYQTADGANSYGLYDMSGNVWEWCHDWYGRDYYSISPHANPTGLNRGSPMPDGNTYHVVRGGNWYNGEYGHSRVANRNNAHFRGPDDPDHAWYHIGFRVVLSINSTQSN
jgi:formylglycine-generating enzyme required for sulfatase activity